jgi:lipoprotein-releasing system ATP-binding protein
MSEIILSARGLVRTYKQGVSDLPILKGIDLDIRAGESISIVGASGSGKSTLLHILGTLDRPDAGELYSEKTDLLSLTEEELAKFRNREMGFVFQTHHLLAEFTALENVMIPCRIAGDSKTGARIKALSQLDAMGLSERVNHYPNELSGESCSALPLREPWCDDQEFFLRMNRREI